jgi:hypothetical protein
MPANLQVLTWEENDAKKSKSCISLKHMLDLVAKQDSSNLYDMLDLVEEEDLSAIKDCFESKPFRSV